MRKHYLVRQMRETSMSYLRATVHTVRLNLDIRLMSPLTLNLSSSSLDVTVPATINNSYFGVYP